MAKKIKAKNIKNLDASTHADTNVKGSELQADTLLKLQKNQHKVDDDIDIEATESIEDADVSTHKDLNIEGTKAHKGWIWIVLAVIAAAASIAGYYFTRG